MNAIYQPYQERRKKLLFDLIRRNQVLQHTGYEMFTFKGVSYGVILPGAYMRPKLHPDLVPEMDALLKEGELVKNTEMPYVSAYLVSVVMVTQSIHDLKRLLPSAVASSKLLEDLMMVIGEIPSKLSDEWVEDFLKKNDDCLQKIKQRLATNLIQV